jgi:hypothetical protein
MKGNAALTKRKRKNKANMNPWKQLTLSSESLQKRRKKKRRVVRRGETRKKKGYKKKEKKEDAKKQCSKRGEGG